jgi:hypothetical protein
MGMLSLSGCLAPVSEDPPGERVALPDGGFDLICGDGGVYGIGIEARRESVLARDGGPPVFSKACTHIRGSLYLGGEIDFTPYQNIKTIEGSLDLGYYPVEEIDLVAFRNLRSVQRIRVFSTVGRLLTLDGLSPDTVFGGGVEIFSAPGLKTITALKKTLVRGGRLMIKQTELESLDGLQGVTQVQRLEITGNLRLKDLSGLDNLTRVDGDVDLRGNPSLRGVDAFLSRIQVSGTVYK